MDPLNLQNIPTDLLRMCFSELDVKNLFIVSCACKRFYKLTNPADLIHILQKKHIIELTYCIENNLKDLLFHMEGLSKIIKTKIDDHPVFFCFFELYYRRNLLDEVAKISLPKKNYKTFLVSLNCLRMLLLLNKNNELFNSKKRVFQKFLLNATRTTYFIRKKLFETSKKSEDVWATSGAILLSSVGILLLSNWLFKRNEVKGAILGFNPKIAKETANNLHLTRQ